MSSEYIIPHSSAELLYCYILTYYCGDTNWKNSIAQCFLNVDRSSHQFDYLFLKYLHWLPIYYRVLYKLHLITNNLIHYKYPKYRLQLTTLKIILIFFYPNKFTIY